MIKVAISRGMTSISLESDADQLKEALEKAFGMFLEVEKTNPVIPFSEQKVHSVEATEGFDLNEEEIDMIEKAKEAANERRAKVQEEMVDAVVDIVKDINDQKKRELEEKVKREEERAKKEKEADDAENEARIQRAKARKKRSLLFQIAEGDDEVTSEMIAQKDSDEEEAREDAAAQIAYDEKYKEKEEPKVEVKAQETKPAETTPKAESKPAKEEAPKPEAKQEEEPAAEEKTEEEPAAEEKTAKSVSEKVKLMLSNQNNKKDNVMTSIRRAIDMFKETGMSRVDALTQVVVCAENLEDIWQLLGRRPETIQAKLKFSKEESAEAAKNINTLLK